MNDEVLKAAIETKIAESQAQQEKDLRHKEALLLSLTGKGSKPTGRDWRDELQLTDRERKEISFCKMYARHFAHGTTGHNSMMLVAKLAEHLDQRDYVSPYPTPPAPAPEKKGE
jgi:hypothetical protein